jgi:hypothetical protein
VDRLLDLAATQLGVFTRWQAHRCGLNDKMLLTRVRNSMFERVARHVFRVRGAAGGWGQDLLIAVYSGGDHCVASHRAAAALHQFDGFRIGPIEVTVPRGMRYRRAG